MPMIFRWREKASGRVIAKVAVEFHVGRDDLVTAALRLLDDSATAACGGPADVDAINARAASLTRGQVEKQLREDLRDRGQTWFEFSVSDSLLNPHWEEVMREAAGVAVSRLWPNLTEQPAKQ